tara:strand:+ start:3427 stop:3642 length:216 start_codon:yes stop_codon:yes gene_type:complete
MTKGFDKSSNNKNPDDGKARVTIDQAEIDKVLKQYKKIGKYMKSSIFQIKTMDGTEELVSKLLEESQDVDL